MALYSVETLNTFGNFIRSNREILKCDAGEDWRGSDGLIG
jgi:hypothetical protein